MYRKQLSRVVCELQEPAEAFSGSMRVCFLSTWANSVIEWVTPIMQCVAGACGQTAVYIRALISLPGLGGGFGSRPLSSLERPSVGRLGGTIMVLASRHTTGLCWTTETLPNDENHTRTTSWPWPWSLDKAWKHEHLHSKSWMYKMQKCVWAVVKQRLKKVPVPFIHWVEMGGWLNDSVWPCAKTLLNSVEFNRPCQQSGLGSWWFAFWTSWAEPPGPYTCPSSPPGPWPPPPLPYFSGKHTGAHSEAACLHDGAVVLWETLKKIGFNDKMESEQWFPVLEEFSFPCIWEHLRWPKSTLVKLTTPSNEQQLSWPHIWQDSDTEGERKRRESRKAECWLQADWAAVKQADTPLAPSPHHSSWLSQSRMNAAHMAWLATFRPNQWSHKVAPCWQRNPRSKRHCGNGLCDI